ncbi:MAG: glycosyl transferase family 4 [Proteobacteria bacterium]|nr:glycosyl transferase family 4 [Pseudomonadota bacterium]
MSLALFFGLCIVISGVVIRSGMALMGRFGVLDHPGGHKQHDTSTPFVGGFGVIAVVLTVLFFGAAHYPELSLSPIRTIALGASILFVTGFADDIWHLCFKARFMIQALVAIAMVFLGGVELASLGELFPGWSIGLGIFGVPFSIFATVGLINALNMIDGIDGLSGSLSFISLGGIAIVASVGGHGTYTFLAVALMGGVAGFLYFNLRYPSNARARVFLGDNGSMLLGFVFAWLLIALSQGEQAAMAPVTALWLFGVPLLDTVSVMLRRIWLGKSPFLADRNHLHHLFIRAGFRVSDTVWIVAIVQVLLGAIGLVGNHLDVPEYVMFGLFLTVFAAYFFAIFRPWRVVPGLRRLNATLGLPSVSARGVFVGYFDEQGGREVLETLARELGSRYEYRLSLHRLNFRVDGGKNVYALLELDAEADELTVGEVQRLVQQIKVCLSAIPNVRVRPFMQRNSDNDRRENGGRDDEARLLACSRQRDRRMQEGHSAFYELEVPDSRRESDPVRV